eukprot:UN21780
MHSTSTGQHPAYTAPQLFVTAQRLVCVLQSMDVFVYHIRLQNLKNPKESNSNVFNSARGPIENSAPRKVLVHTQSLLVQTFSLTVFVNTLDH